GRSAARIEAQGGSHGAGSESRRVCPSGAYRREWKDGRPEPLPHAGGAWSRSSAGPLSTCCEVIRPVTVAPAEVYSLSDLKLWHEVTADVAPPLRLAVCGDPVAHSASPP